MRGIESVSLVWAKLFLVDYKLIRTKGTSERKGRFGFVTFYFLIVAMLVRTCKVYSSIDFSSSIYSKGYYAV